MHFKDLILGMRQPLRHEHTSADQREGFEVWRVLLAAYTRSGLTKPEDKLVALSALAARVGARFRLTYRAGLWQEGLAAQLNWSAKYASRRPPAYRAPSWSWASVEGEIQDYPRVRLGDEGYHALLTVQFAAVELVDPGGGAASGPAAPGPRDWLAPLDEIDPACMPYARDGGIHDMRPGRSVDTGQVKGGWLRVEAPLLAIDVVATDHRRYGGVQDIRVHGRRTALYLQEDDEGRELPRPLFCTPLAVMLGDALGFEALALAPAGGGTYYRVGYLAPAAGVELDMETIKSDPLISSIGTVDGSGQGRVGFTINESLVQEFYIV